MEKNNTQFTEETEIKLFGNVDPDTLIEKTKPFLELMMKYSCALKEITTKFEVLNSEFSLFYNRNPVESIKTRLKQPRSIMAKLKKHGTPITVQNIRDTIFDVAGARIICSYPEDIYSLVDMLARQDDITVLKVKDYISNPKPNGYRSLHLIVEVPIFLSDRKENMVAEVQFRTIAMDFWASLEHKLKYKKNIETPEEIVNELKQCADEISRLDNRMQAIHKRIENL
ncbi:MAG: GTP pyrophosphokinase family protein [Christensenellales bacterium]